MGRSAANSYKISFVAAVVFAALCAAAPSAWTGGLPSSLETGQIEGQIKRGARKETAKRSA